MKKQIIAFLLLMVIGAQMLAHFGYIKAEAEATEQQVIPDEAIRLRILANSDSEEDQALKRKVRDRVKAQIDAWVVNLKSIEEARRIIQSRLPELEKTVEQTLREEKSNQSFTVEFGKHIKFPTKVYGNFLYPAGEYEAVLVQLGKGEGANWWCVLFPPLCFLDFSSGTAVAREDVQTASAAEGPAEEEQTEEAKSEEQPKKTAAKQKNVETEQPKQEERNTKELQAETENVTETEVKAKDIAESKAEEEQASEPKKKEKKEAKEKPAREEADQKEQSKKIVVKEEEEPQVKFFIGEVFSSLFSK